jgi:hypothetical protein
VQRHPPAPEDDRGLRMQVDDSSGFGRRGARGLDRRGHCAR